MLAANSLKCHIGVVFDRTLSLEKQVTAMCQSAFYYIRNISRIRKYISYDITKILVHAFVTSRLDHCNSLLYGIPKHLIQRLQYVHNAAARLISLSHRSDHITPVLKELHWLPVKQRIKYKIILFVYKAINGIAPAYINDLISPYVP
jgi:hypothetical protein